MKESMAYATAKEIGIPGISPIKVPATEVDSARTEGDFFNGVFIKDDIEAHSNAEKIRDTLGNKDIPSLIKQVEGGWITVVTIPISK